MQKSILKKNATTYLGISEVSTAIEVFDTVFSHFEPISEAINFTGFRHTAPRSNVSTVNIKT